MFLLVLLSCGGGRRTGVTIDVERPTVRANLPHSKSTGVALDTAVAITFSEAMDHATSEASFSITPETAGTFEWKNKDTTMEFYAPLQVATTYNVCIAEGAEDLNENAMRIEAGEHCFWFVTVD
jgi:hypothetical protein